MVADVMRAALAVSARALLVAISLLGGPIALAADVTLVASGATWKYLDDGTDQGTAWRKTAFNDAAWASGAAELGYGDGDEATVVSYGPNAANKYITSYFRHTFTVAEPAAYQSLTLQLKRDDGAVVYLNGSQVWRNNMPSGSITSSTLAVNAVEGGTFLSKTLSPSVLRTGTNVLAVEVHQASPDSNDISFDLRFVGATVDTSPGVTRGPYLQSVSESGAVVRWRTGIATSSRVRFGTDSAALSQSVDDPTVTVNHIVSLSGLAPDTRYYYSVGSQDEVQAGGDTSYFFFTAPASGSSRSTRIWAIGDSGTANANSRAVRDAYLTYNGSRYTDLWLMLGDNAYASGTDSQYQKAVFDMYPALLRQTALWPTFGNHDGISATSATQTGPYYDIFSLPRSGEAGGFPSGTEAYYSFNFGDIHLVCLDSQGSSRSSGSAMLNWLAADLASNASRWTIAFWHHPPYSKGSHDSDVDLELIEMRENVLPVLEQYGVDLVLTGHSHSYERSYLLDGHYGFSSSLTGAMILNAGSGRITSDGAYTKPTDGSAPNEGAVYAVAGSASEVLAGPLDHPAMFVSLASLGSMVIDIVGNRLDARFLESNGSISDFFTIIKAASSPPPPAPPPTLVASGATWKYLDDGTDQGTAWRKTAFSDAAWASGAAELGYGDGDEATVVSYGPNAANKYITTYFRRTFTVTDPGAYQSLTLQLKRDDGAVVYLNGSQVWRSNLPSGAITTSTLAISAVESEAFLSKTLSPSVLRTGTNVLAVEVHQASPDSSDISFDLRLTGY